MQEAIVHVPCFHGRFFPQYTRYQNGAYMGKPEFQAIHAGTHNHWKDRGQDDMGEADKYAKWQERMDRAMNVAEVVIGKQRHGPIGIVNLHFDANLTRFSDLDQQRRG